MAYDFATVLVFAVIGIVFVFIMLLASRLLQPRFPSKEKQTTYECGEVPVGKAWFNFNPRFYVVALVFVIFEVEVALMLPVVLVYRALIAQGHGALAFAEILTFLAILAVGLAWVWAKGDLDWIKRLVEPPRNDSQRS